MKTIVTGGAGFIGSHLVDALVDAGHEVVVVDLVDVLPDRKNSAAKYVQMDVRDENLAAVFAEHAPEIVFHLAAHIDDRASVKDPVMNASHNVSGSINVFESARQAGTKKIIFASSSAVYGLQDKLPASEKMIPRPRTPYGASKLAGEKYLDIYSIEHGMVTVALRFANVYGPRQDGSKESGAIAIFTSKLLANESPFLNADGLTTRDYVYVGDVVAALVAVSEKEISGVFNVGTGKETSTSDLFAFVKEATGASVDALPRPEVRDATVRLVLKNLHIKQTFGWKPTVSLKRGIKMTVKWYQKKLKT